ncbi:MAG: metallophosphoesterase [Lachnospiraceae bacterium]|nr:metallophosphoesterase [Lachnospiraceae bacterium]
MYREFDAKRILIISDTHGRLQNLKALMQRLQTPDLTIHCGDLEMGEEAVQKVVGSPLVCVRGNMDYDGKLPAEQMIEIRGKKIWITHGNRYGVSGTPLIIREEAIERGMDIVMFGHTHRPYLDTDKDITVLNPGSLSQPRQDNGRPSFMMMEIDDDGEVHYSLNYL